SVHGCEILQITPGLLGDVRDLLSLEWANSPEFVLSVVIDPGWLARSRSTLTEIWL
ncbi:unnamed protein product, partial [marine sediment metagenome]